MSKEIKGNQEKTQVVAKATMYEIRSGILPPPNELEQYEKLCPNITKELLETYKQQVNHRIEIEKLSVKSDIKKSFIGQIFSFIIVVLGLVFSYVLVLKDKNIAGLATFVVNIGLIAGSFYKYESQKKKEENIKK